MRSAGRRRRWASEGRQQRQTPYRGPRNIQSPPEGWSGNRLEGCSSIHYRRSTLVCQVNNYPVQRTRPAVRDGGRRDANRLAHHWGHRSEEHTSELQSLRHLVCRLLLEKKTHYYTTWMSYVTFRFLDPFSSPTHVR